MTAQSQRLGARGMGHYLVTTDAEVFVPNLIDWRHSIVQANKRADGEDDTLEICGWCGCEVDVEPQPHRPGCPGIGKPRVSVAAVLESTSRVSALSEREPDREEAAVADPSPADVDGVDASEVRNDLGGVTVGAAPAARSESAPTRRGRPKLWTAEKVVEELQRLAGELGRTPTSVDLRESASRLTPNACKREFGSMAEATAAAGLAPAQPAEKIPATEEADDAQARVLSGEEATPTEPLDTPAHGVASDPLSVAGLNQYELVACGRIMEAIAENAMDLPVAQRQRVARFVAALLEEACR